jgi:hypothetical protein
MTMHRPQDIGDVGGVEARDPEKPREQVMNQHVLCAIHVLGRVGGLFGRHAFTPTIASAGGRFEEKDVPLALNPEGSLEWSNERNPDAAQLDSLERELIHQVDVIGRSRTSLGQLTSGQAVVNHLRPRFHAEVVDAHLLQRQQLAGKLVGLADGDVWRVAIDEEHNPEMNFRHG